jgi:putative ABC transport system permease protein
MGRWIDLAAHRLRSLFRSAAADRSLQREIDGHLEDEIAENVARGMSRDEARLAALRAFGPVASIADGCRDTRRVSVFQNLARDLRYTFRSLTRQPLLVAAATLSIGVAAAANSVVLTLASELLFTSPSVRNPEQLAYIRLQNGSHVSHPQWRDLNESGALAGIAGYQIEIEVNWTGPERSISIMPLIVTANFFDLLGVPVASGRGFTTSEAQAEQQPDVVVVSHAFWQNRLGGDPAALGRVLTFNGRPHTLVGILPRGLRAVPGLGITPDVYLPLSRTVLPALDNRRASAVMLIGRLRDGQTLPQGRAALQAAVERLDAVDPSAKLKGVEQFAAAGGLGQLTGFAFPEIFLFFALLAVATGLVLAIACANVAGLLLSRGSARRREVAVRSALGASRGRLVQQFLAEAFWLALGGTLLGVAISFALTGALSRVALPVPLPFAIQAEVNVRLLMIFLALLTVTTGLCGLLPALQVTRPSLVPALKQDEPRFGRRRWTLRTLLVIAQVAVALVLLLTGVLFLRNLGRAHDLHPGFDTARTIVAQVSFVEGRYTPATRAAFLQEATERLAALPGVQSATYAHGVPLTMRSGMRTGTELQRGDGVEFRAQYDANFVGPAYFATMGIPVVKGREFLATDRDGAARVALINQEFARRYFSGRDPLGQQLLLPGASTRYAVEIVGVVGNSKHRTLGEDQQAAVYESFLQRSNRSRFVHILVRTAAPAERAAKDVEGVLNAMDRSAAIDVSPMRSALAFAFLPSQIGAALLGALGVIGLVLAMVGLYATIAYSVSRRTAEIGIRMALGASRGGVLRMIMRDAALFSAIGIGIGLAFASLITPPLAAFLVAGLSPGDPVTFAGTALLLFLVSLAAASSPARRATHIDPVAALRRE